MPKLSNRYLTLSLLDKIFPYNFVRKKKIPLLLKDFYRIGDIFFELLRNIEKKKLKSREKLKKLRWDFDGLILIWKLAFLCVLLKKNDHTTPNWAKKNLFQGKEKNNHIKIANYAKNRKRRTFQIISKISGPSIYGTCIEIFMEFSFHETISVA